MNAPNPHTEKPQPADTEGIPPWLKRVQQNSWEPEILLSGFILIGLLQLPDMIRQASLFLRAETLKGNLAGIFTGATFGVYLLIGGLVLHLLLRSVWVGFIGLSYSFPQGIQAEKLRYQPRFAAVVHRIPSLKEQILKLEKVCSSIFATCFFLIMVILGVLVGTVLLIAILLGLEYILVGVFQISLFRYIDPHFDQFLLGIILFFALDFILLGVYRRFSLSARLFYPLYKLVSWLTFSRIYRSIYYLYATNISRKYLALFFALFILLNIFGQPILQRRPDNQLLSRIDFYHHDVREDYLFSGYFRDRNTTWPSSLLTMPSPVVSGRFLEVGLLHLLQHERSMYQYCDLDAGTLKKDPAAAEKRLRCATDFYQLRIDETPVEDPGWMYHFFQERSRKGFIAFVDVSELAPGRHSLAIYIATDHSAPLVHTYFFRE